MTNGMCARRAAVCATLVAAAFASCGGGERSTAPARIDAREAQTRAQTNAREESIDVRPIYPRVDVAPHPLAERLCDAIHGLPARRKAECCRAEARAPIQSECVRALSIAIADRGVEIDEAELAGCERAQGETLAGCDWVTPLAPAPAPACRALLRGQRAVGSSCRSSHECRDGLFCRGAGPTDPGVCTAPLPAGAACGQSVDALSALTSQGERPVCTGSCRLGRCVVDAPARAPAPAAPLKPIGEPCSSPFECRASCIRAPGAKIGRCGTRCSAFDAR